MKRKKVLLIGWDAADWKVINPLMDEGMMPNLERMVNGGTIGNLATLDPPLSPMLWTSIATGVRPYKHGIIGFAEVSDDGKSIKPITLKNRKVKAIWNILSEHDYKTHVVGWWPSHPAEAINGIMVSNFYQHALRPASEPWVMQKGTVCPDEKSKMFAQMRIHPEELTENHIGAFIPHFEKINQDKEKSLITLARIIADNATVHAAATYILEYEEWDFAAVYYDGIDHFNHAFMKFHPPRNEFIDEKLFEIYKGVVTAGYRFHDMMLGRLLQLAGDETTVILISDHGFHPDHLRKKVLHRGLAGPADEHSRYGIICAKGNNIKRDEIIYGAGLLDITPTLLSLFDLPVGDDMDGKPLASLFENPPEIKKIKSWSENYLNNTESFADVDNATLQQLADLGYIEHPGKDKEKSGLNLLRENNYFLAKALMDGGKYSDAVSILEKLFNEQKWEIRFAMAMAVCYQKMAMADKIAEVIDGYEKGFKEHEENLRKFAAEKKKKYAPRDIASGLTMMKAMNCMAQQKPDEALELLQKLEQDNIAHGKVHLRKANCYVMKGDWENAAVEFEKETEYNYDEPEAHHGLGFVKLKMNKPEEAVEHLLDAIGLKFDFPFAHYHLGEAFYRMEDWEKAISAYEVCLRMNPGINKARQRIADIFENHLQMPEKAIPYRKEISRNLSGTIYVVSGLPRSGTSMMMKMLQAGGMEIFSDEKRQADISNPRGYFEHEAVKSIARNSKWIGEASGKVIKVITPLIPFLPLNFKYKIIFMERDMAEVMLSQQAMLKSSGKSKGTEYSFQVAETYRQMQEKAIGWSDRFESNVEYIKINYADVIEDPADCAEKIAAFISTGLDVSMMKEAVDATLYRSRLAIEKAAGRNE